LPEPPSVKSEPTRVLTIRLPKPRWAARRPGTGTRSPRQPRQLGQAAGHGFARLTVAPVILVVCWLLPGLPLLLAGDFAPVPMLLIAAPLATALAVNVLHKVPSTWPVELPGRARDRGWMPWLGICGTLAVAIGFTAWQLALSSPPVIVTRTPGAYFQTGYWIAQHGALPIPGSLAAFGGSHAGLHLSSIGFFASGRSVVPGVMAGLPMLLAAGFWTSGIGGGAVVGPVLGGLAVLTFAGLVGRLAGRHWAPAGALALALTLPEMYTSRATFTEPAVQILLFGGMSMVVDALALGRQGATGRTAEAPTAAGAPAAAEGGTPSRSSRWRRLGSRLARSLTRERTLAALGGLAIGLTSLLSLGSLGYLVPIIAVAGVLIAARPWAGGAFLLAMCAGCGCGLVAGYVLARPYADAQAPILQVVSLDAASAAALAAAALISLTRVPAARRFAARALTARPRRPRLLTRLPSLGAALPVLGGVLIVLALGWLAARPYLVTVRGGLGRAEANFIGGLQRAAGLRVDPTRLYVEDTGYWVIWYAGIATVLLGGFGAVVLVRRCARALLSWRDSSGAALNWALPLAVVLGGSVAVLWQPFTVPDQPWASRRLVPVVLPGLILLATWAAAWLTRRARDRGAGVVTGVVVAVLCLGAMVIPSASTAFGAGLSHSGVAGGLRPSAGGLAQHRVGVGEAAAVRGLCAAIGRSSSVVIVDRRVAGMFAQVIRGECGVPVAWISHGTPPVVAAVIAGIRRAGRQPVMVGATSGQVAGFGGSPLRVLYLVTTQNPHELTRPPGAPWPAKYVIWMSQATAPTAGV
jgi:hypothetical protein